MLIKWVISYKLPNLNAVRKIQIKPFFCVAKLSKNWDVLLAFFRLIVGFNARPPCLSAATSRPVAASSHAPSAAAAP